MADAPTTFATISTDAPNVYIAARQYQIAERNKVLGEWGMPYALAQRNSKTLRVDRWKRFNLPTATLTEGTPPDAVALSLDNQDVTVEQWGIVALITDIAEITVKHSPLQGAIDRTGLAISEVDEREIGEALLAGTNVVYGGAAASRATLAAGDKLTTAVVLKATTGMRARGAMTFEGQLYGGVMAVQQEGDLLATDTTFQNASNFARVRKLEVAEIGIWMGVQWQRSNFLPIFQGVAVPGTQSLTVAGTVESGAGSGIGSSKYMVVGKDITNGFERRISQEKTAGAAIDVATMTMPTSTNYVYDVYNTAAGGAAASYKLVYSNLAAAATGVLVNAAAYTAGTLATPPAAPLVATGDVFTAFVFGQDGYGRVTLDGMSVQAYITPPGATWSNPLAQGRKVGSKVARKPFIIDNNFFTRIETTSTFAAGLPA